MMHYSLTSVLSFSLLSFFSQVPSVDAWDEVGHKTVATIAGHYLTSDAKDYVARILPKNTTIVDVATWADWYRRNGGGWSAGLHFIDAEDHPPDNCSVIYKRDCPASHGGCIVSGSKNYTTRIQSPSSSSADLEEALKFLIHFFGDVTQPLHNEGEAQGGNGIYVLWNGQQRRLHGVWDAEMVNATAGAKEGEKVDIDAFAAELVGKIEDNDFAGGKVNVSDWISCLDDEAYSNKTPIPPTAAEECMLSWAADSNALICTYVLTNDIAGEELSGAYFEGAKPIIEVQIAKGGYRLAAFLNKLATPAAAAESNEEMESILAEAADGAREGSLLRVQEGVRMGHKAGTLEL